MRLRIACTLISLFFSTSLFATDKSIDICTLTPGVWTGTFTQKICNDNECTHSINALVNYVSGNAYHAEISLESGETRSLNFTCDDGQITLANHLNNTIRLNCAQTGPCLVIYEDQEFKSVMLNRTHS